MTTVKKAKPSSANALEWMLDHAMIIIIILLGIYTAIQTKGSFVKLPNIINLVKLTAARLPMALGGLLSAIAQGRVAAGSINILAKKPDDWSKGLILCGIVEFYAILSLLASMLMLLFM